jgi:hypothetical protein
LRIFEEDVQVMESVVVPWPRAQVMVLAEVPNWVSGTVPVPPVFDLSVQPENVTVPVMPVPFTWPHDAVPVAAAAGPATTTLTPPVRSKAAATVVIRMMHLPATNPTSFSRCSCRPWKPGIPASKLAVRHGEHRSEHAERLADWFAHAQRSQPVKND